METVKIKDKEYKYKNSLRAQFTFERLSGKGYAIKTTFDVYLLFFSMLLAYNEDFSLTFDEFIDECDEDPSIGKSMDSYLTAQFNRMAMLKRQDGEDPEKEVSKKKL